ncbi:hypothetical protein LT337_06355 [Mycolicibacterium fortuitum]|nr:hypothetical protein LT337_06355 [Mycolicibacterium fortuitum]
MFETGFVIDLNAGEEALVDQLAAMNRAAAGIAAGQARVTAMLEAKRHARKAARASRLTSEAEVWPPRSAWPERPRRGTEPDT